MSRESRWCPCPACRGVDGRVQWCPVCAGEGKLLRYEPVARAPHNPNPARQQRATEDCQ